MQQTRESWTRIGIACATACFVAGICYRFIPPIKAHSDGMNESLTFLSFWLVLCIFACAFSRQAKQQFVFVLTFVMLLAAFICTLTQDTFKEVIHTAFSAVVYSLNEVPESPETRSPG